MLDSVYIEVAAALAVVFFLAAAVVAAVNQWLTRLLDIRAKVLWRALANVLDSEQGQELDLSLPTLFRQAFSSSTPKLDGTSDNLSSAVANAAPVRSLASKSRRRSTRVDHIPTQIFAKTLVAIAADENDPSLENLKANTAGTVVGGIVAAVTDGAQDWLDQASKSIEQWYDEYMERLSELYRLSARKILFVAGFLLAITLNVNAVGLVGELAASSNTRAALTGAIDLCAADATTESCSSTITAKLDEADATVGLPIVGDYQAPWSEFDDADGIGGRSQVVLGWLLTGFAISLGAPFWFDVARRLSGITKGR